MASEESLATPVAIIGGGPVGLILALYLDYYGVRCTLFNAEATTRWHPKGNGQSARTMEHYRQLGIADEVRRLGLPGDHPFDQGVFTRLNGYEIWRFHQPSLNERMAMRRTMPVTDQLPEPMYHVNQMYTERLMLERARACPNIDVRFGWKVRWFTQDERGVTLAAAPGEAGDEMVWHADYAVGCDGGRGLVRKTLGIPYEGSVSDRDYYSGLFYSVYMRIPDLYPKFVGHRPSWMYWTMNPDTVGLITTLNGADEFMMLIKANAGGDKVDELEVVRWVQRAIGAKIPVEVISYVPWQSGAALVAERYKAGRIMLAGNSVHLFTPVGGFGMSTGIDDASNLSWKLAAMIQGWGGRKLLDSYQTERKPIGYRNTGAARQISQNWGEPKVSAVIEQPGPEGDAMRLAALDHSYVKNNHFARPEERDATGVQLGARYDASPIVVSDGAPPPPDDYDEYVPSGVPGGRAPHLWLDGERVMGSSLFDRFGRGFTLLRLNGATARTDTLVQAAASRGIPLTVLDLGLAEAQSLYERNFVLIRPDQYIAWRGDALPEDADALLLRVTGH